MLRLQNLSVLAYANDFTLWHYKTTSKSIMASNYFNPAANIMNKGDLIIANVNIDGRAATQFYIVADISDDVVTICAYN